MAVWRPEARLNTIMSGTVFDELKAQFSSQSIDVRGENAHAVATKFLQLLIEQVPEEDERKKLMSMWMRSVKDNDYSKFSRALRRYRRRREEG